MAKTIRVAAPSGSYDILIGPQILSGVGETLSQEAPERIAVISHPKLLDWYGAQLLSVLQRIDSDPIILTVPAGERSKSFPVVGRLCERLAQRGLTRKSVIVAFGGGVIGDLAGFVAAIYHRGLRYLQIPTTLLAQVDSSVGGKVGADLRAGKNLVGAFLQPIAVIADTSLLRTLSKRHLRNGMAEVLKYGFILSPGFLDFLLAARQQVERRDATVLAEIVEKCCAFKAAIVAEDEHDLSGSRARLNLGHTVGHALETIFGYRRLLHGEAIAVGMVVEARTARRLGLCAEDVERSMREAFRAYALPVDLPPGAELDALLSAMYRDKKAGTGKLAMTLPLRVGAVKLVEDVEAEVVASVLREMTADA